MTNTILAIAATEAREAAKGKEGLRAKVKAAMLATRNHWMAIDEETRFRAALAGALMTCEGEEKDRLEVEIRALNSLSALLRGIPVDVERVELPEDPLHLIDMWKQVKEGPA